MNVTESAVARYQKYDPISASNANTNVPVRSFEPKM